MIRLVGIVEEGRLEVTLFQTDLPRSCKSDVDFISCVQTLHQQTDSVSKGSRSFRMTQTLFSLACNGNAKLKPAGLAFKESVRDFLLKLITCQWQIQDFPGEPIFKNDHNFSFTG